jgi:hypothetical protein
MPNQLFSNLPKPALLLLHRLLILCIDDIQRRLAFRCCRQILKSILGDQDVVFDSYASNWVVVLQKIFIDIFRIFGVFKIDFF